MLRIFASCETNTTPKGLAPDQQNATLYVWQQKCRTVSSMVDSPSLSKPECQLQSTMDCRQSVVNKVFGSQWRAVGGVTSDRQRSFGGSFWRSFGGAPLGPSLHPKSFSFFLSVAICFASRLRVLVDGPGF